MLRIARPCMHAPSSIRLSWTARAPQARTASHLIFAPIQPSAALLPRAYATAPSNHTSTSKSGEMDLHLFHKIADRTLEEYQEEMNKMQDSIEDLDMEYGMGVVTLKLGGKGTYVINKQTPARQIWLSSPVSGPKRYAYAFNNHQWRNTRDGHALCDLLSEELSKVSGLKLRLKDPIVN